MKQTHVIIVADTGTLKAYRISETSSVHKRKAEEIKKVVYRDAHLKIHEMVTDRAGRFRGSGDGRSNRRASGENHDLLTELKNRFIRHLAHDIEGVIKHTPASSYYVALPKTVHNAVMAELKKPIRAKITKELSADLIKEPLDKVRARFKV